jgi:DNA-directed RNA polymerase alpha subunit
VSLPALFRRTIYELDISLQTASQLRDLKIVHIADLAYLTEIELRRHPGISLDVISEVKQALAARGLSLGTRTDAETGQPLPNPVLLHVIDELNIAALTLDALKAINIYYIGDLIQRTEAELLKAPGISRRIVQEIRKALRAHGLDLAWR